MSWVSRKGAMVCRLLDGLRPVADWRQHTLLESLPPTWRSQVLEHATFEDAWVAADRPSLLLLLHAIRWTSLHDCRDGIVALGELCRFLVKMLPDDVQDLDLMTIRICSTEENASGSFRRSVSTLACQCSALAQIAELLSLDRSARALPQVATEVSMLLTVGCLPLEVTEPWHRRGRAVTATDRQRVLRDYTERLRGSLRPGSGRLSPPPGLALSTWPSEAPKRWAPLADWRSEYLADQAPKFVVIPYGESVPPLEEFWRHCEEPATLGWLSGLSAVTPAMWRETRAALCALACALFSLPGGLDAEELIAQLAAECAFAADGKRTSPHLVSHFSRVLPSLHVWAALAGCSASAQDVGRTRGEMLSLVARQFSLALAGAPVWAGTEHRVALANRAICELWRSRFPVPRRLV